MPEFFEFQLGPRVVYQAHLVDELGSEVARLGGARALMITDHSVVHAGMAQRVQTGLAEVVEVVGVFSDVPTHSSVATVEQGAALARETGADLLITVGGGSPLNTAKAIRMLLAGGGQLRDYHTADLPNRSPVPLVAIPTTAGTGSEVAPFATIRDEVQHRNLTFASPFLAPDLAVLDPTMTRTLPKHVTAATGMDALTHAIEAFVSTRANVISDSLALQAIDMISNNLRAAVHTGDDMEARGQMLLASCMAGMAFSSALLGIVHAMSHTIGGQFDVHHGTANAILLPHGMRFNSVVVPNRYSRIARALGVNAGGRAEEHVIEDGIAAVTALAADCGLPTRLRDVGVPEDAVPAIADGTLTDSAIITNPRVATVDEVGQILRAAW